MILSLYSSSDRWRCTPDQCVPVLYSKQYRKYISIAADVLFKTPAKKRPWSKNILVWGIDRQGKQEEESGEMCHFLTAVQAKAAHSVLLCCPISFLRESIWVKVTVIFLFYENVALCHKLIFDFDPFHSSISLIIVNTNTSLGR